MPRLGLGLQITPPKRRGGGPTPPTGDRRVTLAGAVRITLSGATRILET